MSYAKKLSKKILESETKHSEAIVKRYEHWRDNTLTHRFETIGAKGCSRGISLRHSWKTEEWDADVEEELNTIIELLSKDGFVIEVQDRDFALTEYLVKLPTN